MGSNLVLLFEAHHRLDPRLVRSLSSDDLDILRSIVRGSRPGADRVRALDALAIRGVADFTDVARTILSRSLEDMPTRTAAATILTRWRGAAAEPLILETLDRTRDEFLAGKPCGLLARIGGPLSLDTLNRRATSDADYVRRMAGFASTIIGHRVGLAGAELAIWYRHAIGRKTVHNTTCDSWHRSNTTLPGNPAFVICSLSAYQTRQLVV